MPDTKRATYFTDEEVKSLDQELVAKLDMARHIAKVPFYITCGLRTIEQNEAVGGVSDSAHLTGNAVDLACHDSAIRFSIVKGLIEAGFKRIEVAENHIHADNSQDKPQNVMWLGVSH